jgi:hypothetical protein
MKQLRRQSWCLCDAHSYRGNLSYKRRRGKELCSWDLTKGDLIKGSVGRNSYRGDLYAKGSVGRNRKKENYYQTALKTIMVFFWCSFVPGQSFIQKKAWVGTLFLGSRRGDLIKGSVGENSYRGDLYSKGSVGRNRKKANYPCRGNFINFIRKRGLEVVPRQPLYKRRRG